MKLSSATSLVFAALTMPTVQSAAPAGPRCVRDQGSHDPFTELPECKVKVVATYDPGYVDSFRGWYDVAGCGEARDYCRWVGNSGGGPDPSTNTHFDDLTPRTHMGPSWWSCHIAGSGKEYTLWENSHFLIDGKFHYEKHSHEGALVDMSKEGKEEATEGDVVTVDGKDGYLDDSCGIVHKCSSEEKYGWTLKSWYLDHTNGGSGKWGECEKMCREDPSCNSWMGRNSGNTCYLSKDTELARKEDVGWWGTDHHPHTMNTKNCNPTPSGSGDPHFVTWSGQQYDFHGGCDLVLLKNDDFANGLGMKIHIRTSIRTWWSYIESAVVQIGDNTLEVQGGIGRSSIWINGGEEQELKTADISLGDFHVHFNRVNDHHTLARIDLGSVGKGDAIGIETFKDFVRVNVKNKSNKSFGGASGLLGTYPDGDKVGRDGKTIFQENKEFGQEWQVLASEPSLFHTVEGAVQPPNKCLMPEDLTQSPKRRRLGEVLITEEEAAEACARVSEMDRDACIFDVMATNDKEMAGSY